MIWKTLMLAERRFRRLNAPMKLIEVYLGSNEQQGQEATTIKQEGELAVA